MTRPLRIGLTGNIATGKSTVAQLMEERGFVHLDTDQLARDVIVPPSPVLDVLAREFGAHLIQPDGTLDREGLGQVVFNDPEKLQHLNSIMFPAIGQLLLARMKETTGKLVVSIPLLFEAHMESFFDEIWVVVASEDLQIQRLMARNGFTRDQALTRMACQMTQAEKAQRANVVISNNEDQHELELKVDKLLLERGLM